MSLVDEYFKPSSFSMGFFAGIFAAIGIDPEIEIYKALAKVIGVIGGYTLSAIFIILVVILLVIELIKTNKNLIGWVNWCVGFLVGFVILTIAS